MQNLDDLKCYFESDINSVRAFEKICSFQGLVEVLHDRDVLKGILNRDYDIGVLTIDELAEAVKAQSESAEAKDDNLIVGADIFPGLSTILAEQWMELAPILKINVQSCFGRSNEESAKILLELFHMNCGRVCQKETEFRLLRALRLAKYTELYTTVSNYLLKNTELR